MKLRTSWEPCFWFVATKMYGVWAGVSKISTEVMSPRWGWGGISQGRGGCGALGFGAYGGEAGGVGVVGFAGGAGGFACGERGGKHVGGFLSLSLYRYIYRCIVEMPYLYCLPGWSSR